MPKAEVGSTKFLNNKLKSKGLQRLRWYCQVGENMPQLFAPVTNRLLQVCERQMRDENGFKMHTVRHQWIPIIDLGLTVYSNPSLTFDRCCL
jgi:hypothetical protein